MLLAELLVKITGDDKKFKLAMGSAGKQLNKFGAIAKKHAQTLKNLTFILGSALIVAVGSSMKKFIEFEKVMKDVNAIAKLTNKDLKTLSDQVVDLSEEVGKPAKELAAGLYDIFSAGFQGAKGLKILKQAATAATAGVSDTATAARTIVSVLNAYGKTAEDAEEVSDNLFKAIELGQIRFSDLASSVGTISPIAKEVGVEFNELMAAQAAMSKSNSNMAETSTQLRQLMFSLIKPSDEMKKLYKKMGIESVEAEIKQKGFYNVLQDIEIAAKESGLTFKDLIVEKRGYMGALLLTGKKAKIFKEQLDKMKTSAGATADAFAGQSTSLDFKLGVAKAEIEAFQIKIGEGLSPAFLNFLDDVLKPTIKFWGELAVKIAKATGAADIGKIKEINAKIREQKNIIAVANIELKKAEGSWSSLFTEKGKNKIRVATDNLKKQEEVLKGYNAELKAAREEFEKLDKAVGNTGDSMQNLGDNTGDTTTKLEEAKISVEDYAQVASNVLNTAVTSLLDANATLNEKLTDILKAGLTAVLDVISLQIKAYIALETAKAVATGGLTAATIAASAAQLVAVEGLKAAVSTITLDEGGITTGPTFAQLSKNSKPEAIIPLDRLATVMRSLVPGATAGNAIGEAIAGSGGSSTTSSNGGDTFVVNVYPQKFDAREVDLELQKLEKRRGLR